MENENTYDGFYYIENDDRTSKSISINYYYGNDDNIIIPQTINGVQVKSLGSEFLDYCIYNNYYRNDEYNRSKTLTIPPSVDSFSFAGGDWKINKIICLHDSYAENYAISHNIPYEIIDEYPNTDPAPAPILGDIDDDNMLSYLDVSFLIDSVANGVSPQVMASADMDGNGQIDYIDVSMLIDKINNPQ